MHVAIGFLALVDASGQVQSLTWWHPMTQASLGKYLEDVDWSRMEKKSNFSQFALTANQTAKPLKARPRCSSHCTCVAAVNRLSPWQQPLHYTCSALQYEAVGAPFEVWNCPVHSSCAVNVTSNNIPPEVPTKTENVSSANTRSWRRLCACRPRRVVRTCQPAPRHRPRLTQSRTRRLEDSGSPCISDLPLFTADLSADLWSWMLAAPSSNPLPSSVCARLVVCGGWRGGWFLLAELIWCGRFSSKLCVFWATCFYGLPLQWGWRGWGKKQPIAEAKPQVVSLCPRVSSAFNGTNFSLP